MGFRTIAIGHSQASCLCRACWKVCCEGVYQISEGRSSGPLTHIYEVRCSVCMLIEWMDTICWWITGSPAGRVLLSKVPGAKDVKRFQDHLAFLLFCKFCVPSTDVLIYLEGPAPRGKYDKILVYLGLSPWSLVPKR